MAGRHRTDMGNNGGDRVPGVSPIRDSDAGAATDRTSTGDQQTNPEIHIDHTRDPRIGPTCESMGGSAQPPARVMAPERHFRVLDGVRRQGPDTTWRSVRPRHGVPDVSNSHGRRGRRLRTGEGFAAYGHKFDTADLTGGDFSNCQMNGSSFRGTIIRDAVIYRSDLSETDFTGADLARSRIARVEWDYADLAHADLRSCSITKTSFCRTKMRSSNLSEAVFTDCNLINADLRGANLRGARFEACAIEVLLDETTLIEGMTGIAYGPAQILDGSDSRALDGQELADWLSSHGANVRILVPGNQNPNGDAEHRQELMGRT
ncbi:pentapeptide repeat-containing protein [Nocardia cyriacigeorgica]|uniref:Pentapeptide repeat-containing protein n=1 Tax=Nocardia cyriacigeorgica TaxID=135487 RepID=A0A5R8NIH1_9NOCA|nr:pentapeptide repeat-containing protein [Nocardia cyriacigeorgica]